MARMVIGSVLGGIAMWLVGFLFWGTPLSRFALTVADEPASAAIQSMLAQQLGATGTGAYPVPWPGTPAATVLYGQGPTAMVFYNSSGYPVVDSAALIGGLVLAIVCALLIGVALLAVSARVTSFADRMKLVILFAVAATLYTDIGQPVFNHMPWGYFIYLWLSNTIALIVAGAVIARWFLPKPVTASSET